MQRMKGYAATVGVVNRAAQQVIDNRIEKMHP
jgi:hypothetical protein